MAEHADNYLAEDDADGKCTYIEDVCLSMHPLNKHPVDCGGCINICAASSINLY